ncbi:MAG: endonuclease/exonuclease/phosphatase family protein [Actinomycetaceae bacterium]
MRRGLRVVGVVVALLVVLLSLYTLRPIGLGERIPVAQVIALKGVLTLAMTAVGILLIAVGALLLARRRRRATIPDSPGAASRARPRPGAVVALVCGVVTALAGASHGLALADRGLGSDDVVASGDPAVPAAFTVLSLNTLGGASTADDVAEVAERTGADVLALPETPAPLAAEIEARLEELTGGAYSAWTSGSGPVGATSMVVSDALGPYEQVDSAGHGAFGRVHLRPTGDDDRQPVLVAAHPVPPVSGNMGDWRGENFALVGMCERAARPTVIAGDLNMTLDHDTLASVDSGSSSCRDAGVDAGIGGIATWPTSWPAWAGTVIDHVLVSGGLRGAAGEVMEVGGSDHRGVVVELVLGPGRD